MAEILICDDENNLRELLAMALRDGGHNVHEVSRGREALKALDDKSPNPELVITDLKLPDVSGLDVLRHAKKLDPERPVLLITAYASTETAVTAMKEGAFDYLEKPFRMEDLHLVVTRALEQGGLRRENAQLKRALKQQQSGGEIIGKSEVMRQTLERACRVARTDATVLITGESGTGKELMARYLHKQSARADGPFVPLNCAAIPENLIESELFGHAKGAFSGAVTSRKGMFVEADGGTLMLDEIGEMPAGAQVKLLRVLQERTVRPVGGSGERPVDVRVVAATNRDLDQEVKENRFREDLYYRVNVVNLHLPPLRERREDVPLLVSRFVEQSAQRYSLPVCHVEPEVMDCLASYPFPGNIRELENLMEGAVSLSLGDKLELSALPQQVRNPRLDAGDELAAFELPEGGVDLEALLAQSEKRLMHQALERCGGNKTRAAELLGLSFRSFRYRFSKLEGLER